MSQDHFNHLADEYDDVFKSHIRDHYLNKRVAYIKNLNTGPTVLDYGCGTGLLASKLKEAGFNIYGTDYSESMLKKATERGVKTRPFSSQGIPFESDMFDFVYSVAVFHHLETKENVQKSLKEMLRVTKPGGKIMVWDHNPRNPYWSLLMPRLPQDHGDERLVPASEIIGFLKSYSTRNIAYKRTGWVPEFVPQWSMPLMRGVEWAFERLPLVNLFSAHNVVMATKN